MKYTTETRRVLRLPEVQNRTTHAVRALRYLRIGAAVFAVAVILCVILLPSNIVGHYGFSFYGNFSRTFIPYAVGLSTAAIFLLRACREMRSLPGARSFRVGLLWSAVALFGIILTPSFSSEWLVQDLHVLFGLSIFVTQAVLSVRYLVQVRGERADWFLVGLQFLAIVLVVLSIRMVGLLALMLPAQLLAIGSFGTLLIRAVGYHARQPSILSAQNM